MMKYDCVTLLLIRKHKIKIFLSIRSRLKWNIKRITDFHVILNLNDFESLFFFTKSKKDK